MMREQEIVAGFTEWLRQWTEDPEAFSKMGDEAARNSADGSYGARAAATLTRCAADAMNRRTE